MIESVNTAVIRSYETSVNIITGGTLFDSGNNVINNYGKCQILEDAYIKCESTEYSSISNKGELSIEGGKITATKNRAITNHENATLYVKNGEIAIIDTEGTNAIKNLGTLSIEGGTISSISETVATINSETEMTVTGGKITATGTKGMAIYNTGTLTVTGGYISSNWHAIGVELGGTATVTGATIIGSVYGY